jgi:hypothetical protein
MESRRRRLCGQNLRCRELVGQGGVQRNEDARHPSHPCESGADFFGHYEGCEGNDRQEKGEIRYGGAA